MKECSTSSVIREMQIKTTVRHHYRPTRRAKRKQTDRTKRWRGPGGTELSPTAGGVERVRPLRSCTYPGDRGQVSAQRLAHERSEQLCSHWPRTTNCRAVRSGRRKELCVQV